MQDTPRQSPLLGILKGAVIAIGALLPGISGGALCVIMGIYKPMMALLADPIHQFKKQIGFFWPIAVGLIVGTLPSLLREARQQGVARGSMAALAIALVVMLAWMIPMSLGGQANVIPNFGWWCLCGVLWGLGIIVPGMSPSNIFFFLGLATPMYASIGALDLGVILPMGVCLLLTVVLLSRGVGYCLKRWYSLFMHAVVGVVLASTVVILPPVKLLISPGYTFAMGLGDWLIYAGCFAAGAVLAWALGKVQGKE